MAIAVAQNQKILNISSKRQITIPQAFYNALGFGNEAECILKDDMLIVRPAKTIASGEFAEQILAELVEEGFTGENLLAEFKRRQAMIKPAVSRMIDEADAIARGEAEGYSVDEVFGKKK